jgi:hypothetical protein
MVTTGHQSHATSVDDDGVDDDPGHARGEWAAHAHRN